MNGKIKKSRRLLSIQKIVLPVAVVSKSVLKMQLKSGKGILAKIDPTAREAVANVTKECPASVIDIREVVS